MAIGVTNFPLNHGLVLTHTYFNGHFMRKNTSLSYKINVKQKSVRVQNSCVIAFVSLIFQERQRIPYMRAHSFQVHTFQELPVCQICQKYLWGVTSQGLLCIGKFLNNLSYNVN